MNRLRATFYAVAATAWCTTSVGWAQTITPLPTVQPKPTLQWLASINVSPSKLVAGGSVTGTVTLLRAAFSDMTIGLGISNATAVEGNILASDGAIMPGSVVVKAGSDRATFTISTSAPKVTTLGSKTYTVSANYGKESVSTTFTTTLR